MSELRVLHLSPTWFGDESVRGGGERYPLELAIAMRQRTPTRLVAFGGRPGTRHVSGFDIEVQRTWRQLRGRAYDAIGPGFIRALGWANVIHCHQARSGLTALAALIGRPLGKRVFVTDHGGGGVNWVRRLRIGRWIDGQLAQSEFAAATLPYVGRRTEVIYAGVDTVKYSPGTKKTPGQVVYVGRLLPHKGIETAIRGLPAGASLDIYGRPYDTDYLEFVRSEALSRPVRIHLGASDFEVIAALRVGLCFRHAVGLRGLPSDGTRRCRNSSDWRRSKPWPVEPPQLSRTWPACPRLSRPSVARPSRRAILTPSAAS